MLRAGLRDKRLRLSEDDRRRLAVSQPSTMAARTGAQADLRRCTITQNGTTKVSATSSSHLCRQARVTLAPSCLESDLGAFSSTTAVPCRSSLATVAPRWARPA